ncbi:MAG TPA: aminotransferase class I/II-fold pyridoxal phosphate-dependent enzyme, partial [Steroidobacteraceae bacterium]|nr:aminotransferase class I/II-fold pyridoxal phosphate-dependent enzyme [Steroidobacteraceae bacterium]
IADVLEECPAHHRNLPAFYQARRDHFCALMAQTRFRLSPTPGTYFQLADYSAISDSPDLAFARWLTAEHGVAAIPVSVFSRGTDSGRLLRFCFAKDDATLEAAVARLERI